MKKKRNSSQSQFESSLYGHDGRLHVLHFYLLFCHLAFLLLLVAISIFLFVCCLSSPRLGEYGVTQN